MNLYDAILKSMPKAAFKLNVAGTAYEDATGNGNTLTGTLSFVSPILNGNPKALSVNTANAVSTTTTVFRKGQESQPFSLMAWILPTTFAAVVSVASHTGIYDGLAFDGNNIRFRIALATLGNVDVEWPVPDFAEVYHAVGTYSKEKIQLYINRVLVSELELTSAQIADGFATEPTALLYTGQSVSGNERLIFDGLAIYNKVVSQTEVSSIFAAGRNVPLTQDIVSANGGTSWDGVLRDIVIQKTWDTFEQWNESVAYDTAYTSGTLVPLFDDTTDLSLPGTWRGTVGLGATPLTSIYGIKVLWNGDGVFTVASSLDGTNFTNLTNGQLIPSTLSIDPTGGMLDIRVTFTGGVALDVAEVRDITVVVYATNYLYGSEVSRDLLLTGLVSTAIETNEPIERNSSAGLSFYGGYATLKTDITDDPRTIAALEFYIRRANQTNTQYVFDARSDYAGYAWFNGTNLLAYAGHSVVYINGIAVTSGTQTLSTGEWAHVLYIPATPFNSDVVIGAAAGGTTPFEGQVGLFAAYPVAPDATQALALYNAYGGTPFATASDTAGITIAELSNSYTNYVLDWSITGAGGE